MVGMESHGEEQNGAGQSAPVGVMGKAARLTEIANLNVVGSALQQK